ncbi:MAG: SNF2-related protein [Abditibacteriales bacterium]|nr:SNF2-related protein [Abditibacteriales bacterium]MDW8366597.1 SNF2-related protein [Abditibacteriales bacterium]
MLDVPLQEGDIVAGLEPDEHVRVRRVAPLGSKTLVEGIGVTSRREIKRPLSPDEPAQLTRVRGADYTFDGDAEAFLLGVEAERIRIAYQFARDEGFFITSVDFIARHEGCLNAAQEGQWDMIVVDEAHKLSAYEYGRKVERSDRYQAVEQLAPRTDHLLFLTATPHRGRKDTFRRLLMLLDEDLFQRDEFITQRIHEAVAASVAANETFAGEAAISRARNRFFLRRLKEELVNWDNQPLFQPRHTQTVGYELTPEELELYHAITRCLSGCSPTLSTPI